MICSGDSKQGFGEKDVFFSPILIHVHEQGCALCKIEGTPVLALISRVPNTWFLCKKKFFLVAQEQKLGAMGHQALLEHSFEEITQIRNK